MNKARSLK